MSQSLTLQVGDKFAATTTLKAYPVSNWLQSQLPPSGAPVGSSTSTATVGSDTTVTFTGLVDDTDYFVTDATGTKYLRVSAKSLSGSAVQLDSSGKVPVAQLPTSGIPGAEVAYAEITTGIGPLTNAISSPSDLSGLQITIPAGTPAYMVEFFAVVQINTGASWVSGNGFPQGVIQLVDEGAVILGSAIVQFPATAASQALITPCVLKRRMPATATSKTLKLQAGIHGTITNKQFSIFAGPGNLTANEGQPPAYLQAVLR